MGRTDLRIAGRYRLVERLGDGGMSVVWRGYDEILNRPVAVKVLTPRLAADQQFRDRLRQEALAAARLCHPHITGVFDFGESPLDENLTVPYVVMELHDGETVAARLNRRGPLPWRDATTIAVEVASALATAHARGLVHRDVTPANVMLTAAGAKVVDFGISAIVGQRDSTPDGSLLGTPAYLAPERLNGAQVSTATDVYGLGLLLYRGLTGCLPWPAENTAEALRAHLYAQPAPLPDLPGLPAVVAQLCLRCLAKKPADRPSAALLARDLGAVVGIQPIVPVSPTCDVSSLVSATVPIVSASSSPPGRAGTEASRACAAAMRGDDHARNPDPAPAFGLGRRFLVGKALLWSFAFAKGALRLFMSAEGAPRHHLSAKGMARRFLSVKGTPRRFVAAKGALRLRAGLRVGAALHLGTARPLGGGLFAGGNVARDLVSLPRLLPGRYRHRAAWLTLAALVTAGLLWSGDSPSPEVEQAQAAPAPTFSPASCSVRYQLQRDSGSDYEAQLTVVAQAYAGAWRVQFSYPGTQRLTGVPEAVTQHGRKVLVHGRGAHSTYTLRGDYRGTNPLPLSFTLNGSRCRTEILASAAVRTSRKP